MTNNLSLISLVIAILGGFLFGCEKKEPTLFEVRTSEATGLTFNNVVQPYVNDTLHALNFEYIYNGGGVAAGDFNNDGLTDLYFAGNFVSSKLFLNNGSLKFQDITGESKTGTKKWATGVSVIDINNDGWSDIYVCVAGQTAEENRGNLLFINQGLNSQGVPEFKEEAKAYGLADTGYSTMAAFLDYDKDGDMDLYLLTNSLGDPNRNNVHPKRIDGEAESTDRLYRNNGDKSFTNVSREAGILIEGWGLGVCVSDINQDGWPDVYVANDFISNDLIWINQKDGTFINKAAAYLKHQSHNGMGVDIADYNNDQLPDIVVLDMLPEDNYREKMMIAKGSNELFLLQIKAGFQPQYMRNTLQLNLGSMPDGEPVFSEIGYLAGVSRTDWSWAPLFADFDNDGFKDLFVANGYRKDVTNLDYMAYTTATGNAMFGTPEVRKKRLNESLTLLPEVKVHNYMYKNTGGLVFKDVSTTWGLDIPTYSNGAVYADLDNDGDLDIVVNNIDDDAIIYENTLMKTEKNEMKADFGHYIRVKLLSGRNSGLSHGAKVQISLDGKRQFVEFSPYRGYKSTVEPFLHFGLGASDTVDTLTVIWPDHKISQLFNLSSGQVVDISYDDAHISDSEYNFSYNIIKKEGGDKVAKSYLFADETYRFGLQNVLHEEAEYNDYKNTPLLHRQLSKEGPYLAVGDLNNDGLEDAILGGDAGFATRILFQERNGTFRGEPLPFDSLYEDRGILIFDSNQDSFNDIYIVSGGNQFPKFDERYQDRLYINDGTGKFTDATNKLPPINSSGSVVKGSDIDNDGDIDLFVGGRLIPGEYPLPARSYILRNDGGKFTDVTEDIASGLQTIGLVTDASWVDYNKDSKLDLVVVGEWMPVTVFLNQGNSTFRNVTADLGLDKTNGWYFSVNTSDINDDGFPDLVLGNNGLNSYYKASEEQPLEIFANDFDNNGSLDPILTHYNMDERYVSFFRDRVADQINGMKRRFQKYEDFAKATFDESFSNKEIKDAYHGVCYTLSSYVLENQQGKSFKQHPLPFELQLSPITSVEVADFNNDGKQDLLIVGNSHAEEPVRGWYDASYGACALGDGAFNFRYLKPSVSGFVADGDIRTLKTIEIGNDKWYIFSRNNDEMGLYSTSLSTKNLYILKESN